MCLLVSIKLRSLLEVLSAYQLKLVHGFQRLRLVMSVSEMRNLNAAGARSWSEIIEFARPLFKKVSETPLPPLREINYEIPLMDEARVYSFCPSKYPKKFRDQWVSKRDAYLLTGCWCVSTARNSSPLLLIPKIDDNTRLRVVGDFRQRNLNTKKMSLPIPNIHGIQRRVAAAPFCSIMDGSNAFKQIQIIPEHVIRTAMATPDGTMVSLVIQQGDYNGPATFQASMCRLFVPFIGC